MKNIDPREEKAFCLILGQLPCDDLALACYLPSKWIRAVVRAEIARRAHLCMDARLARLDSDGMAKPLTELTVHVREGDCIGPASVGLDGVSIRSAR